MHAARIASLALAGLGVALLVATQFVPFATFTAGGGALFPGTSVDIDATPWQVESESSFGGQDAEDSHSWYDSDADGERGVSLIRWGAPLLAAGLGLGLVGALLTGGLRGVGGPALSLAGGVLAATATVLLAIGMDRFFEDADYDYHVGFYFAIFGSALLLAGAVAGLASPDRARSA